MAQYLHFYRFAKAPFCPGTNSEDRYWSPSRHRLCSTLARAITERKGLIMITGEEGVGKTTLLHAALESVATHTPKVISVPAASLSFLEILRTLSWELAISAQTNKVLPSFSSEHEPLGLESSAQSREISAILRYLTNLLMDEDAHGRGLVLVLDDAHCYSVRTLQQLQHLTRLQAKGRSLLQIVLIGQPELERKMNLLPLWRVRRQLVLRISLPPLTLDESLAYLCCRLAAVMEEEDPAFAPDTLTLLAGLGDGNPYRLNVLGHNALIRGYEAEQRPIPPESIEHILQDVGKDLKKSVWISPPLLPALRMTGVGMVAGGIAALSFAGVLSLWQGQSPAVGSSVNVEPAFANAFVEVANQGVTTSDKTVPQPPVVMNEKRSAFSPVVANPPAPQEPQSAMVKVVSPAPLTTVKADTGSRSTDKRRPQQKPSKAVAMTPTKKSKGVSSAKVETTTKVVKGKRTTSPPQSAVAKRSLPAQKKPVQPRVVQQSQARTQTQSINHDGLFDE